MPWYSMPHCSVLSQCISCLYILSTYVTRKARMIQVSSFYVSCNICFSYSLFPTFSTFPKLASVIVRCHLLPVVIICYRPSSHVTTRCHPFSPVVTRYHPLPPVVTRCHLSPTVSTPFALRASHWYQTRYILLHSGEMLIWWFWDGKRGRMYSVLARGRCRMAS